MTTQETAILTNLGRIALEIHRAEALVAQRKVTYYDKLHAFNLESPDQAPIRLDPRDERCAEIVAFSKTEYAALKAAKRKVHNIKRRIDTAIRNSGLFAEGANQGEI